nr:DUF87 domain-containing protein [Candidatus Sigynarchaeota archaeon]
MDAEKAQGIIQSTWEVNTKPIGNVTRVNRALTLENAEYFAYHVPCFILYRFLHFPTILSSQQERNFQVTLENPPDSIIKGGTLNIGKLLESNGPSKDFFVSLDDLKRHVFINGTTGSGKSSFIQNLLGQIRTNFPGIPLLVIELKGEYAWMEKQFPGITVLEPGKNFGINIFDFTGDVHVHAERMFDIMKSSFDFSEIKDFSPQMEKVLVDLITMTCSDPNPAKRNFTTFFKVAQKYINDNKAKIPFLESTWIGIENRIRRITTGPLMKVFDGTLDIKNVKQIFSDPVIVSLGNIINLGGTKDDLYFFSNLLLKHLWDINIARGPTRNINHITIIDDSQFFSKSKRLDRSKDTNYFEDIALLLRGTGEVLIAISTRPDISEDVLSNCGLIVCFQTKFKEDIEKLQSLLHLQDNQISLLEILPEHTSVVKINSYPQPFLIQSRTL